MPITALYAALLAPLYILLSARVIGQRRSAQVAIGHGEDTVLLRRMGVHANFAEYVPFTLVCLALTESLGVASFALHAIGIILLLGRYVHAFGVSQTPENLRFRVTGMVATFAAIAAAAAACLIAALPKLI